MAKNAQTIILDQRTLEILFRLGCPDEEIINLLKTGNHEKTDDPLVDELLDELIIKLEEIKNEPAPEPEPKSRGGNHNPNGANQYSDIETDNRKDVYQHILQNVGKRRKDLILITKSFNCNDYEVFAPYITEMPEIVIKSVENWIRKVKLNESVSIEFIIKQFFNFAKRNNFEVFKQEKK